MNANCAYLDFDGNLKWLGIFLVKISKGRLIFIVKFFEDFE
jgi:hypothetical protein